MSSLTLLGEHVREAALELAWRQWTALGVSGTFAASHSLVDPEALLVSTFTLGRYDARLFDEVLDWLTKNASLLDTARLKRIAAAAGSRERALLGVAGRIVCKSAQAGSLWRGVVGQLQPADGGCEPEAESLFYSQADGAQSWAEPDHLFLAAGFLRAPLRLRGLSGRPPATNPACLRFQMRALVGMGARAEVLTYLLTHQWSHGRLIADRAAYGQAAVASYLLSLHDAGLADRREEGKKALYRLTDSFEHVLSPRPLFVDWKRILPALTAILDALRSKPPMDDVGRLRLAETLIRCRSSLRAEGFETEIGDLRGWALRGPILLEKALEEVTAKVVQLSG